MAGRSDEGVAPYVDKRLYVPFSYGVEYLTSTDSEAKSR